MSFTDKQRRSLVAKLKHRHVKTRFSPGGTLSYVEGWHVIAEANRIFGYDCWDRQTLAPQCVWTDREAGQTATLYTTKVRITVRAGGEVVVREGVGAGFGKAPSAEAAHEIALKAAETDATKRALATFGNPFGLALYDKDRAGVTRPTDPAPRLGREASTFVLWRSECSELAFDTPDAFSDAAFAAIREIESIDTLYAFWERNRKSLVQLKSTGQGSGKGVVADAIVAALKARARVLGRAPTANRPRDRDGASADGERRELGIPKEKRLRNKEHLKFVARQPCLICGRQPTHAHHVRFAQRSVLGMKVSDEFTVPLCSVHHDAVHRRGNEKSWWMSQAIDPLEAAAQLWAATRGGFVHDGGAEPDTADTPPADADGTASAIDGKPTVDHPAR